jgi:thymidylate synthase (FAD)
MILEPKVKLISITPNAEKTMAMIARVSNPANQANENIAKLLKYCLDQGHVSIFEQASMTLEIETHVAIATQILRHRSFTFQMFSQRYASAATLVDKIPMFELRGQDTKNRQNSVNNISPALQEDFTERIEHLFSQIESTYQDMLSVGIAKECARFILPQSTATRLYMTGNIRSWIFYILERTKEGVQKEHSDLAKICKEIFINELPIISESLGWK